MIHICTLKYGTKYSSQNVNGLYDSVKKDCKEFNFYCLTDDVTNLYPDINILKINDNLGFYSYFNKLRFYDGDFMGANYGDEIIILDIDLKFVGDSSKIIEYPVQKSEHLFEYRWSSGRKFLCPINSGVQKFLYDGSQKYVLDQFMENPDKWLLHDLKTINDGGQFGDQTFVYDRLKHTHHIKYFPKQSIVRLKKSQSSMEKLKRMYNDEFSDELFINNQLNPATVLVHYSGEDNDVFDVNFLK